MRDARMIAIHQDGTRAESISIGEGWLSAMRSAGFEERVADVGDMILTTIAILSAAEATRVNDSYKSAASEELRRCDADPKRDEYLRLMPLREVTYAARVEELLQRVGKVSYYSPWIVVETADID